MLRQEVLSKNEESTSYWDKIISVKHNKNQFRHKGENVLFLSTFCVTVLIFMLPYWFQSKILKLEGEGVSIGQRWMGV